MLIDEHLLPKQLSYKKKKMLIGAAKPVGRPKVAPCSKMAIVDSGLSRTTILDKAFHVVSLSFEGSHTSLLQELSGLETCQTNSIVTMVLMGPGNSGPQKLNGFVFPDLKTGLKSCPETRQATGLSELGLVDLGVQWTVYTLSWEWGVCLPSDPPHCGPAGKGKAWPDFPVFLCSIFYFQILAIIQKIF
jgi:hypothetical protein